MDSKSFVVGLIVFAVIASIPIVLILPEFKIAAQNLVNECNAKYGINNYTIENGHACSDKEGFPDSFIGMHDCFACVPKGDG